jgi:hypothetical protein
MAQDYKRCREFQAKHYVVLFWIANAFVQTVQIVLLNVSLSLG